METRQGRLTASCTGTRLIAYSGQINVIQGLAFQARKQRENVDAKGGVMKCYECGVDLMMDTYKWEGNVYCHYCLHNSAYAIKAMHDELAIILVDVRKDKDELTMMAIEYGLEDQ
jgi:hypothetical protein